MLSFIIPTYKSDPQVFKKACKALTEQSLKDWEAIFVMDGEDSRLDTIINSMDCPKFKIVTISHAGAQRARNEGAKHAKGDIWVFWDCDCVIEPGTAQHWINKFNENPDIGFVYSGYKFLNEQGGIPSQDFDPYLLRVRNYISACFPLRKKFYPGWNESLKSLQDWDFWLSVVERGGKGLFCPGYAFSTALPTADSISGKGCTDDVWLERMDAVKELHDIPDNSTCVVSVSEKVEGIRLAKLIGADFQDMLGDKPNRYKTVIQVGFSLHPNIVKHHSSIFNGKYDNRHIFWTIDNIIEMDNFISQKAVRHYSSMLNTLAKQYVEDMEAKRIIGKFNTKVLPLPLVNTDTPSELPDKPAWIIDVEEGYNMVATNLEKILPDVKLIKATSCHEIKDVTGLITFNQARIMNYGMKRMLLNGRHIVSNIQQAFCGYINDTESVEVFMDKVVDKVRRCNDKKINTHAVDYYTKLYSPESFIQILEKEKIYESKRGNTKPQLRDVAAVGS